MKSLRQLAALSPFALAAVAACDRREWSFSDTAPVAGTGGSNAAAGSAGACALDRSQGTVPVFAGQTVMNTSPARRELYAYVTDSDAATLRRDKILLPPSLPTTTAVTSQLMRVVVPDTPGSPQSSARRAFVEALLPRFQRVRSTWPNPWALRLVSHAASEHMNPVRIVLRKEALIVRVSGASMVVLDLDNREVKDDTELDPERVAAVFMFPSAQTAPSTNCESGFRDLALGNEAMVESWSLATPEILARLESDTESLTKLFAVSRQCATVDRPGATFRAATVCQTWANSVAATEYTTYGWSLATPAELYKPSVQNLVNLIDALALDVFEPDPFIVVPSSESSGGAGGAGGAPVGGAPSDGGVAGVGEIAGAAGAL